MSVPVDYTITKIVDELFKEHEGRIPRETIFNVINFQSYTIKKGIEDGDNVHIKYLGKFIFNQKRAYKVQEAGIEKSMQVEQELIRTEGKKSYKIKEIKRIVFK